MTARATRTGWLVAAIAGVAGAAVLFLRADDASLDGRTPAVLRRDTGRAAPERGAAPLVPEASQPHAVAPEPLQASAAPRASRRTPDPSLAHVNFDDEIYGRVFIARITDADGRTPDIQITATVVVVAQDAFGAGSGKGARAGAGDEAEAQTGSDAALRGARAGGRAGPAPEFLLHRASPDPDGLWRWPIDAELGHARMRVKLETVLPRFGAVRIDTNGRADEVLEVQVLRAASLQGRIDMPLPTLPDDATPTLDAGWTWLDADGARWSGSASATIEDGAYAFERNVIGDLWLRLDLHRVRWSQALGALPFTLAPGADETWNLSSHDLAGLRVRVSDARTRLPLADAIVTLSDGSAWPTGSDGVACFLGATPRDAGLLRAEAEDYPPAYRRLTERELAEIGSAAPAAFATATNDRTTDRAATGAQTTGRDAPAARAPDRHASTTLPLVEMFLDAGIALSGRIVDEAGLGVPGARVMLRCGRLSVPGETLTAGDGSFCMLGLPTGRGFMLHAVADVGSCHVPIDLGPGTPPRTHVLHAPPRLAVSVLRADGLPAARGHVSLVSLGVLQRTDSKVLDADGRVDFGTVDAPGELLLVARGESPEQGVASLHVTLSPGETRDVPLVLGPDVAGRHPPGTVRVVLDIFDPRTSADVPLPLIVSMFSADSADPPRDTRKLFMAPDDRTLDLPRGVHRLEIEDPSQSLAITRLTLDTTELLDGATIPVPLETISWDSTSFVIRH